MPSKAIYCIGTPTFFVPVYVAQRIIKAMAMWCSCSHYTKPSSILVISLVVYTHSIFHTLLRLVTSGAVLSIVGNLLVLLMAFKRSSSLKPPELLSVNLAVTDLGAAVIMYPLAVASAWSHRWLGGDTTCIYYALAGFFFGVASIMTLTVMAIVRFVVSLSLHTPKEKISGRTVKLLCLWTWLYALLWALLPTLGLGRYGPEPFGLSCSLAWGDMRDEEGFSFVTAMFSFNLAAPTVVIVCCYFGIAVKLYCTYRHSVNNNNNNIPNTVKIHRRLLTIAVLISAGFIGCWAPYGAVSLWSVLRSSASLPPAVAALPCMFAKSSMAYNPLIYYAFSRSFRSGVRQMAARPCGSFNACRAVAHGDDDNGGGMCGDDRARAAPRENPTLQCVTQAEAVTLG